MFLRNKKTDKEIFIEQLYFVQEWALGHYIECDSTPDDNVYEIYKSTRVLLNAFDPDWV